MTPKNLLILMSDEHDPRYMGCAGHPLVKTPSLDRLAASGTRFSAAYTPCPICVPARASIATGRPVHQTRNWDNSLGYDGSMQSWGHRLQSAGNRVESIGKLHYKNASEPTGFDVQHEPMHLKQGIGTVWGAVRDPLPEFPEPWRMFNRIGKGVSNYCLYDRRTATAACEWLKARSASADDKPWVMQVGFVAPHYPLVAPRAFYDLYSTHALSLPKLLPRDGYVHHPWVAKLDEVIGQDQQFADDAERLRAIAAYFGLISFLDAEIGLVLDALADTGLETQTRVIYTSDHGDNLGSRGLWGKSVLYEESTRVPLILSGPDIERDAICETPANLTDLFPTVLHGVGVQSMDTDASLPGRSLFDIAGASPEPGRIVMSEYHAMGAPSAAFMVRKGALKYHHYVGYDAELFDLETDPEETTNLIEAPTYSAQKAELSALLHQQLDPVTLDQKAKADQAELVERFGGRERAMTLGRAGATPVPGKAAE